MKVNEKWRKLGWRDPLWDYVRFFSVFRGKKRDQWVGKLRDGIFEVEPGKELVVPEGTIERFLDYLDNRDDDLDLANLMLRTKGEALEYCENLKFQVGMTATKLEGWTDSPQAMVAAVTGNAVMVCADKGVSLISKPERRCLWLKDHQLHVTARNLDGAIPALANPKVVWEIKEYWGETSGESKMSDAVYECNLVGRELRDFEERTKHPRINHIAFVDGKQQWASRQSDLRRMIDLFHQGIVDHLFIGKEVESEWSETLRSLI
jgi:hypothetical protein